MSKPTTSVRCHALYTQRNLTDIRAEISSEQTQLVINSITDAYNAAGQANPMTQGPPVALVLEVLAFRLILLVMLPPHHLPPPPISRVMKTILSSLVQVV